MTVQYTEGRRKQLTVAQAIKISRKARNLQQDELPVPYSKSMVSMIERGERSVAADIAPTLAASIDHPAIFMEMAREFSGGFGPAWLDGPNVDLHRSSVREKCIEEIQEALQSLMDSRSSIPPSAETESGIKRRRQHLMQVMDAAQALYTHAAVQCEEYGISFLGLCKEHHHKLRSLRYVEG